ncbi:uncharacterized protein LOC119406048 isoform X2 [Rhipicephalus sanguineus]|uniref:uncharacterized protein LOC119406048 isoform X2 n=1 Tax=Rhipicephalus sanguineus TaxID=34632 RepID=UPI0020C1F1E0|nr:uncharacterized protein LOC119406048 isoform X2 [Rhipicephalus sanguineus]
MKLKPGAVGVVVPARRVPVAIEEKVKAELQRMEEHNVITKEQVRYLGHVFTTQGLSLGPDRVQAILDMPAPSNTSERRLEELRVATAKDPALSTIRSYAETDWPENKEDVPACARPFWAYREEMHTQDGLVFRSNKRLMGRQTRTLLPVPSCHLKPAPLPSRKVHSRLQEIRHKQKVYYNRGARDLRALSPGQRASLYDTHTRTWSPVVVLGSAGAPRSVLVKTEDGREMRRTREHLREVPELPCPDTTTTPSSGLPGSGPVPEPPLPRRSTRERREPRRYPMPERPILPQGKEDVTELARPR